MQIIWKGQKCFQLISSRGKDSQVFLAFDPFSQEESGLRPSSLEADVLVLGGETSQESLKAVKGEPFIISGPGEYEVKEIFIRGIRVAGDDSGSQKTIYVVNIEEMAVCHLGGLKQKELTSGQVDDIGNIDILLIPVGGGKNLDPEEAKRIALQIEPKIIIPMAYHLPRLKEKLETVDKFLKLSGLKPGEVLNKLNIKKKDLPTEETKIIVLSN